MRLGRKELQEIAWHLARLQEDEEIAQDPEIQDYVETVYWRVKAMTVGRE